MTITTRKGTKVTSTRRGYTYRGYKNKKQVYFPLGSDRAEAMKRADEIRSHLTIHGIEATRKKFNPGAEHSVGTDLRAFKVFFTKCAAPSLGLMPSSAKCYLQALSQVIRFGKGKRNVEGFNVADFDPAWLDELRLEKVRGARDAEEVASRKRTFNTILRCVKSIVTLDACDLYEKQGWSLRWGEQVRSQRPFRRVKKVWVTPSDELIAQVHAKVDSLKGDQYVTAAFALHAGLRRREIQHVSRDWIQRVGDENRIWVIPNQNFQQKGRPGYTIISDHILARIEAESLTSQGQYLRNTSYSYLGKVSDELRTCHPCDKPLHELRRFFGTYIANKYDLWKTQNYLRHESPQVTFDSYANSMISEETQKLWANNS